MNSIARIVLLVVVVLAVVGCAAVIALGALVAGGVLVLAPVVSSARSHSGPTIVAEYRPETAELDGTEWVLISLDGTEAVEGSNVTLHFDEGRAGGFAGCNDYDCRYAATGDGTLTITEIAVTGQLCQVPDSIMEQEDSYIQALGNAAAYRIADGRLEIVTAGGETLIYSPLQEEVASTPAVTISPNRGPSGTSVEVVASGFPAETEISVGLGPANSKFSEVARGATDPEGCFSVQVAVEGEAGMDWVFAVAVEGQPGIASPELFHITD
jgi:heat shock protein HslJ